MTIKDIKEAIESQSVFFGIKETIKHKKNVSQVFVAKDARDSTIQELESEKITFVVLRPKAELTKQLNLDFESEVFAIHS